MKIEDICIPTMEDLRKIAKENKIKLKDVACLAEVPYLVLYSKNPTYKTLIQSYEALKHIIILRSNFKKQFY